VIPHFNQHPLITQKQVDFELFKQVVEICAKKEHLTMEGLQKIINIKGWGPPGNPGPPNLLRCLNEFRVI
jgi:hypothetical protein